MSKKFLDSDGVKYLWDKVKKKDDDTLTAANKYVNDLLETLNVASLVKDVSLGSGSDNEILVTYANGNEKTFNIPTGGSGSGISGGTINGSLKVTDDIECANLNVDTFAYMNEATFGENDEVTINSEGISFLGSANGVIVDIKGDYISVRNNSTSNPNEVKITPGSITINNSLVLTTDNINTYFGNGNTEAF